MAKENPAARHIARAQNLVRVVEAGKLHDGTTAYQARLYEPSGSGAHAPLMRPLDKAVAEVVAEQVVAWLAAEFEAVEREARGARRAAAQRGVR